MKKIITVSLFALILIGCKKDQPVEPIPSGAFQYMAYDTTGTLVVDGWLTIRIQDSTHVEGEWHFTKSTSASSVGPQVGDGHLVGVFERGMLSINLNPEYIDNNVFLIGQYTTISYNGTWSWSGFPGVFNGGRFQTKRQWF